MNADALVQGQYIKGAEFGATLPATPTWTIRAASIEEVPSLKPGAKEGDIERKGVVWFEEERRGWVINRTNLECVKALLGDDTDAWIGKRITLHQQMVSVGPRKEPGVRVLGAPHLTEPMTVEIRLPKKKPIRMVMQPTGKAGPKPREYDAWSAAVRSNLHLDPEAVAEWVQASRSIDIRAAGRDVLGPLYAGLDGGADLAAFKASPFGGGS